MPIEHENSVTEAVAMNATATVVVRADGITPIYTTVFAGRDDQGIWLRATASPYVVEALVRAQQEVGISYWTKVSSYLFSTVARRIDPNYSLPDGTTVQAVLIDPPTQIQATQRRKFYRAPVPPDFTEVTLRVWKIAPGVNVQDRPMPSQEIKAQIRDISEGGVGATLSGRGGNPPGVTPDDRLRIGIEYKGESHFLEGRLCHTRPCGSADSLVAGIEFRISPSDVRARTIISKLNRLIAQLRTLEIKKHRQVQMALAGA